MPFDGHGGSRFIPATISDIEAAVEDDAVRERIFSINAATLFGSIATSGS